MPSLDFFSILIIAIGLSADCFAVAVSGSISRRNSSSGIVHVSSSFGLFQALMPLLGWLAGRTVVDYIGSYDHWVAFILLAIIGGKMVRESFRPESGRQKEVDITRGFLLLTLAVATSIDALAVGLSFAFLKVNIALASLTIGAVAFVITMTGFMIGRKTSKLLGKKAEAIGGIILLGIGLRILLSHIL